MDQDNKQFYPPTPISGVNSGEELNGSDEEPRSRFDPQHEDPLWFTHPSYQPRPELDVRAGDFVFRFRPEYAEYFVEESTKGVTLSSIAASLQIPFTIIKYWAHQDKTFAIALQLSAQNSQSYWEKVGRESFSDKGFNMGAWLRMMSTLFPESWSESDGKSFGNPYDSEIEASGGGRTLIFQGVESSEKPMVLRAGEGGDIETLEVQGGIQ